jgi:HEAT repeat protein
MSAWGLIVWGFALVAQDPAVPAATEADADAAIAEFKRNYYRPASTEDELVIAVRTLGETVHAKTLAVLVPLIYDGRGGPVATRIAAALVLANFGKIDGTPEALIRAYAFTDAKPANRPVRIQIIQTLGELKAESALKLINSAIFDSDPWVARAAAKAAGRVRGMYSIPFLIEKLQRVESKDGDKPASGVPDPSKSGDPKENVERHRKTEKQVLWGPIQEALHDITRLRHDCGETWRKWWDGQKNGYKVPK